MTQDLKLTVTTDGTQTASGEIAALEAALERLEKARKAASQDALFQVSGADAELAAATAEYERLRAAQDAASTATAKLRSSHENLAGVLRHISPVLSDFVISAFHAGRVAGDLAAQNLNLTSVFEALQGSVTKNANALKLIGAGGAVVAGLYAISAAVGKMREEFEAATSAIREQSDAASGLAQQQSDLKQRIEDASDARRGGGFTADESREALARVQRIRERSPFIQEEAAIQAVTGRGGLSASMEQLERIAFAIQSGVRNPEAAERAFQRERQQRAEQVEQARKEIGGEIGSRAALEAIATEFTKGRAQDPALIAAIVQALAAESTAAFVGEQRAKLDRPNLGSSLVLTEEQAVQEAVGRALKERGFDVGVVRQQDIVIAQQVQQYLEGAAKQMERAAQKMSDAADKLTPGATTTVNQYTGRIVAPSRPPVQRANGEATLSSVVG